jgi:hypothetical protein
MYLHILHMYEHVLRYIPRSFNLFTHIFACHLFLFRIHIIFKLHILCICMYYLFMYFLFILASLFVPFLIFTQINSVGFGVTDHQLIGFSAFVRFWRKLEYNEKVHQLFIDFKKAYDSVKANALYNILIKSSISVKLIRLSKMCLN